MSLRVGHGIDAHRFAAGRPLMLGGVPVDHSQGLAGHSDGDAGCHALGDAILGASGLGHMGRHFPSSEVRWKDAAGIELLRHIGGLAAAAGCVVISAQVVIVAERPLLAPYLAAMEAAMASALGGRAGLVAASATTSDGLGFTGRGEGIAASAVALVVRDDATLDLPDILGG